MKNTKFMEKFSKKDKKSTILNKKEEPKLEKFLIKISPYLIFIMFILLIIIFLFIMIRIGSHMVNTESNQYYYHLNESVLLYLKIGGYING